VRLLIAFAMLTLVFVHEVHAAQDPAGINAEERAFLEENLAAMARMVDSMTIKPTGDIDELAGTVPATCSGARADKRPAR
jgi:hypothetical protein